MVSYYARVVQRVRQFFRSPANRWGTVLVVFNVLLWIAILMVPSKRHEETRRLRRPPSGESQAFFVGMVFGASLTWTVLSFWNIDKEDS